MPSILLVSVFFPPALDVGAKRASRIARHLGALGWDVQVLTLRPSYYPRRDSTVPLPGDRITVLRTAAIAPKHWGRAFRARLTHARRRAGTVAAAPASNQAAPGGNPLLRRFTRIWDSFFSAPDEWSGWAPPAILSGLLSARRPDLILATVPPFTGAMIGAALSALRRVPLVLDYRDPWTTLDRGRRLPSWRVGLDRRLERACLRRAALVVTTTPAIRDDLRPLGAPRTVVIPNASDAEGLGPVEPVRFKRFSILHAGNFYGGRTAEPILRAIKRLCSEGGLPSRGLALRLVGVNGPEVREMADALGVGPVVEIEEPVSFREAFARMRGADILLLAVGRDHGGLVPAKLFDYLAARRFVVTVGPPGCEAGRLVTEMGIGAVVQEEDIEGLIRVLRGRFAVSSAEVTPLPAAARFAAAETMRELDGRLREVLVTR